MAGARDVLLLSVVAVACSRPASPSASPSASPTTNPSVEAPPVSTTSPTGAALPMPSIPTAQIPRCGGGRRMTVHFYDVRQGLAALVDLPDGRHVLVDTGDGPRRAGCGDCSAAALHLIDKLRSDLDGAPIDVVWITHQHADHIGGAPDVLETFKVAVYVDNGRDARRPEVRRAHEAAERHGTTVRFVDPDHAETPIPGMADVRITPILPRAWPPSCAHDPNECSIALRVDFCSSSVLFTGDAEHDEEAKLDPLGHVDLLQVAHHGSETSTTPGFLAKARPTHAVISAGKPGEGMNVDYCHPRALIVKRLSTMMGGAGTRTLKAFDGERCARAQPSD
jgi:competence protein ComEC